MEAVLSAASIRTFARCVKLLATMSDTLSIDSSDSSLSLRALAASQSGFARFTFKRAFFESYNHQTSNRSTNQSDNQLSNPSSNPSGVRKNESQANSQSHSQRRKKQRVSEELPDESASQSIEEEWRINNNVEVDGGDLDVEEDGSINQQSIPESIPHSNTSQRSDYAFKVKVNAKALALCFRTSLSGVTSMTLKLTDAENEGFTAIEQVIRGVPNTKVNQSVSQSNNPVGALIVNMYSGSKGIFRTFRINFLDVMGPILEPNFRRSQCTSWFRTDAKKFAEWIETFQSDVDEISITCKTQDVRLKSFIDWQAAQQALSQANNQPGQAEGRKAAKARSAIVTDYSVPSIDFMPYNISDECLNQQLIFTFAELRMFISCCEAGDEPVWIFAREPGQPIMITNSERSITRTNRKHDVNDSVIDDDSLADSTSHSRSHASSADSGDTDPLTANWSGEVIVATLAPAVYRSITQSMNQTVNQSADTSSEQAPASQSPRPLAHIVNDDANENGSEAVSEAQHDPADDDLLANY